MNLKAVDNTLAHLYEVTVPDQRCRRTSVTPAAEINDPGYAQRTAQARTEFVRECLGKSSRVSVIDLPVSAFPNDGTFPDGHCAIREAQPRDRNSGLGSGGLHPVREMRAGLPARDHSQQSL